MDFDKIIRTLSACPYIPDPLTDPLCGYCLDRLLDGRGPYPPTALHKCSMRILIAYRSLPRNISHRIAEFAYGWYEK